MTKSKTGRDGQWRAFIAPFILSIDGPGWGCYSNLIEVIKSTPYTNKTRTQNGILLLILCSRKFELH